MSANWPLVPLKQLAQARAGATPDSNDLSYWSDDSDGLTWVAIGDMSGTSVVVETARRVSALGLHAARLEPYPPGTLLFAMYASVGEVSELGVRAVWNQALLGITPRAGVSSRFLKYALISLRPTLGRFFRSNTQDNLNAEQVGRLQVPSPPAHRQIDIAKYLDTETGRIDELIAEQEGLLASLVERRLATITRSVLHQSSVSAPLKHRVAVRDCKHVTADFVDHGFPLASIGQVGERTVDLASAQRTTAAFFDALREDGRAPKPGDLIMTRNATVGAVAMVPDDVEPFALGQDVCLLSPSAEMESRFVYYALKSGFVADQVASMGVGTTFKRINVETIRNLQIPMHDRGEQRRIADALDRQTDVIDELTAECRELIALLKERRSALITAAVTGQIDVRAS